MSRVAKVVAALVVGFVVAVAVAAVVIDRSPDPVVSVGRPVDTSFPAIDHDPSAAADLLDSWRSWRSGTFIVDGTWTRTLDSGGPPLSGPVHVVQDPPRRVVQRLGATVEVFDESVASCEPSSADQLSAAPCVAGDSGMSYDERVSAELRLVVGYVSGDSRIYDVGRGLVTGCFRVELVVPALGSPWGRWAEFCFDSESGALLSSRVRRQSAVDVEVDAVTSTVVTDADFAVG